MATAPKTPPAKGGFNLTNKVGPFPIWVYMAVIVLALYIYEKKKSTTAANAAATATQAQAGGANTSATGTGVANQNGFEQYLQANAGTPTTNPQWEANAESVLVGYGYPAVQVQSALNTYLAGGVLSSVQQEIVNATIEAVGAPPSPPQASTASTASPTVAATGTATPAPPSGATPAPATSSYGGAAPSGSTGYGVETINGQEYIVLGSTAQPLFEVGGGAPVFFGNANGVSQGTAAEANAKATGGYAYVPIQYQSFVSPTAIGAPL